MKIAVTTKDFLTICGSAGQARRFLIYQVPDGVADAAAAVQEIDRLDLGADQVFHEFPAERPHPIDGVAVLITGNAREGLIGRLAARGITVRTTVTEDPLTAVRQLLAGSLPPAPPPPGPHR